MQSLGGRSAGWIMGYGLAGLIALSCTSQLSAQGRGGSTGGASSLGSGSMGGGSFGGGGSSGGGFSGGGSFGGGSSGGGGSFLNSSSGSGGSFSGGGSGIIGTTSSLSAVGNSSSQGGGGFGGGQTRAGATGTGGVSSANPFSSYYADPMAAGLSLSGVSRRATFGNPMFANVNPTTASSGLSSTGVSGSRGGLGTPGLGGSGGGFAGLGSTGGYGASALGMGNTGVRVAPRYSAALNFAPNAAAPSGLQVNLQRMVSQSNALQASRAIQVAMDGPTVVLRGWAADDHDRRLAEGLVRLTPGVHDVRNEVQIATAAAPQLPPAAGQASTRP